MKYVVSDAYVSNSSRSPMMGYSTERYVQSKHVLLQEPKSASMKDLRLRSALARCWLYPHATMPWSQNQLGPYLPEWSWNRRHSGPEVEGVMLYPDLWNNMILKSKPIYVDLDLKAYNSCKLTFTSPWIRYRYDAKSWCPPAEFQAKSV